MYVVGVTGGIGSGKTAVTDRFSELGIEIIDADIAARVVVEPGTEALARIAEHFGEEILQSSGKLDRGALRARIFSNPTEKEWLERLLHPLIGEEIARQLACVKSPYVIFVSPLLFEAGQDALCDRVLVIDVPEEVQLNRTMGRDNNNEAQVRRIIATQSSREQRLQKATDVIDNSRGLEQLDAPIKQLHQQYLLMAREKNEANSEQ